MPRGGWLREVRRWACCGLRRTGGPSPGFGAFSSSPYSPVHRVPLCAVGLGAARHRGIVERAPVRGVVRCVTVFACFSSSSFARVSQYY